MTVSASITTGVLENMLCVPNAALRFTPQESQKQSEKKAKESAQTSYVWVLQENKPLKVALKSGKSDGAFTVVSESTLKVGDNIIIGINKP
jgi:HlyD family secretion protein